MALREAENDYYEFLLRKRARNFWPTDTEVYSTVGVQFASFVVSFLALLQRNHKKISKPKTYRKSDGDVKLDKIIHETVYGSQKSYHSTVPEKKLLPTVKTNQSVTFLPRVQKRRQLKSHYSEGHTALVSAPRPSLEGFSK